MSRTHKLHPEEFTVNLIRMALSAAHPIYLMLSERDFQALVAQFPTLPKDAMALVKRYDGYEQKKGIELSDEEIFTLYVSLDLLGRIFSSNYRETYFREIVKGEEFSNPVDQQFIVDAALPNIDNFFKVTALYAAQTNSLKQLPDIKRRLLLLPMFD